MPANPRNYVPTLPGGGFREREADPVGLPFASPNLDVLDNSDSTKRVTPVAFLHNTPDPEVHTCSRLLFVVDIITTPC